MWMNETLAAGMVPYHHIIGGEAGLGEDRRLLEPAHQYFNWMARHEPHFVNKRSIAHIGVVMGQRTHLFHTPPRGATMQQHVEGMYQALLEGRFLFDFVHEEKLTPQELSKYSALVLPDVALLSDEQCGHLRAFARFRRIAARDVSDEPVHGTQRPATRFRPRRSVRHPRDRRSRRDHRERLPGAHRKTACDPRRLYRHGRVARCRVSVCPSRRSRERC